MSSMSSTLLIILAALMPITVMTSQDIPSPLFYVTLAVSIGVLVQHRCAGARHFYQNHKGVLLCMAGPVIVVLFSSIWHGHMEGLDLEVGLRFLLGTWIPGLAFSCIPRERLQHTLWGFIAAALIASAYFIYLVLSMGYRPDNTGIYNAVGYGSLIALLMTLTLCSLRQPLTSHHGSEITLKLLVSLIAFAALMTSLVRTAWVAVPLFAVIAAILFSPPKKPGRLLATALIAILTMGAFFASSDAMRHKAALAYQEVVDCTGGESTANTSVCIRLQMWRASLNMMSKRPIAGTGSKRYFNDYLNKESLPEGTVSPFVAEGWGEPHNDLMLALASFGIPGGIALLLIYLSPAWVFARRLTFQHPDQNRAAAAMGLIVSLGFLTFGLTETMFRGMRTVSFYSLCIGLFLVLSDSESKPPKISEASMG